jgi:hypothetical protein
VSSPKDEVIRRLNEVLTAEGGHPPGVAVAIVVCDENGAKTLIGRDTSVPQEVLDSALVCLVGSWWSVAYSSKTGSGVTVEELH